MNVLEKILEEIEERIKRLKEADNMCRVNAERNRNFESMKYFQSLMFATERAESIIGDIIRSHMDEAKDINVPNNNDWIPVEERLPEDDDMRFYMCIVENHEEDLPMFCQYDSEYGFGFWHDMYDSVSLGFIDTEFRTNDELGYEKVIAWQPLPEPYKPKEDNSATEHIMSRFMKVE